MIFLIFQWIIMNKFIKDKTQQFFNQMNLSTYCHKINAYKDLKNFLPFIFAICLGSILSIVITFFKIFSLTPLQFLAYPFVMLIPCFFVCVIPGSILAWWQKKQNYPFFNRFNYFRKMKREATLYNNTFIEELKKPEIQVLLSSYLELFIELSKTGKVSEREFLPVINKIHRVNRTIQTNQYIDTVESLSAVYPYLQQYVGHIGNEDITEDQRKLLYAKATLILEFLDQQKHEPKKLNIHNHEKQFNF